MILIIKNLRQLSLICHVKPRTFPTFKMSEIPLSSVSSSIMGSVGSKRTLSSIHDATVHTGGEGLKNSFLFNTKGSGILEKTYEYFSYFS